MRALIRLPFSHSHHRLLRRRNVCYSMQAGAEPGHRLVRPAPRPHVLFAVVSGPVVWVRGYSCSTAKDRGTQARCCGALSPALRGRVRSAPLAARGLVGRGFSCDTRQATEAGFSSCLRGIGRGRHRMVHCGAQRGNMKLWLIQRNPFVKASPCPSAPPSASVPWRKQGKQAPIVCSWI